MRYFTSNTLPSNTLVPSSTDNSSKGGRAKLQTLKKEIEIPNFNTPIPVSGKILSTSNISSDAFKQPSTAKMGAVIHLGLENQWKSKISSRPAIQLSAIGFKPSSCKCPPTCKCNCKSKSITPYGFSKKGKKTDSKSKKKKRDSGKGPVGLVFSLFWLLIKSSLTAGVVFTTILLKVWGTQEDSVRLVRSLQRSGYLPEFGYMDDPTVETVEFKDELDRILRALTEEIQKIPERILQLYSFTESLFKGEQEIDEKISKQIKPQSNTPQYN